MDLWARIKGKDYPIANGASFSDELSETLDSGNIRLVHIHEVIDIKPYDDVIIHDGTYTGRSYDEGYTGSGFYKHMVVFSPLRDQVNLDDADLSDTQDHPDGQKYKSWYFNYDISLVSETRGLEKIPLPNRTITQPLRTVEEDTNTNARTLYDVAKEMVDLYSPYIKYSEDGNIWIPKQKYHFYEGTDTTHLGYKTIQLLKSKACPEMSFQLPNLREVLNRIFNVVDAIPVVKDGIICYLSLSKRGTQFSVWHKNSNGDLVPTGKGWGRDVWQMDGNSYTDRLIREHSNSISKYSVTHMIEDVSFKNSDSGKLSLDNMRLELSYPIYDIKKVYMCYWKTKGENTTQVYKVKQDITKLVLRAEQRQLLSEDWTRYSYTSCTTVDEFRKFKYATIGYYQYSKYIAGWGERYTYLKKRIFTNYRYTNTVIENIFNFYNRVNPYGTIDVTGLMTKIDENRWKMQFSSGNIYKVFNETPTYTYAETNRFTDGKTEVTKSIYEDKNLKNYISQDPTSEQESWFTDFTLFLKTVFFEIDYNGIISSSVNVTKSEHDGPIVTRDNPCNSLAFVENDGVNEKEKVDRLGNATYVLEHVVTNYRLLKNISDYRTDDPLVDGEEPLHKDEIIYRRSYTVFKDHIDAQYTLCKDYVLRNYFTSVYAKLRPYSYTSREESVERKENKTVQVYLSLDHCYYQTIDSFKNVYIKDRNTFLDKFLSFYKETSYTQYGERTNANADNCAYMYFPQEGTKVDEGYYWGLFQCDFQKYSTANSLCYNIVMQDSVSAGVYMSRFAPNFGEYITNTLFTTIDTKKNLDLLSSSLQEWYILPSDKDTGAIKEIQFGIGRLTDDSNTYVSTDVATYKSVLKPQIWTSDADLGEKFYDRSIGVRYYKGDVWKNTINDVDINSYGSSLSTTIKAKFNNSYDVNKDGSERLNITLETELVTDKNIFISNNAILLSDAYGEIEKRYSNRIFESNPASLPNMSSDWAIWRVFRSGVDAWGEDLIFIPAFNVSLPKAYKENPDLSFNIGEKIFTWTNKENKNLQVIIRGVNYVYWRQAIDDTSTSAVVREELIKYIQSLGIDVDKDVYPYLRVRLAVVFDGNNLWDDKIIYADSISTDDLASTNIWCFGKDDDTYTWYDTIDKSFTKILSSYASGVPDYVFSGLPALTDSIRAVLTKSGTNYNCANEMLNYTILFPAFAFYHYFTKSGSSAYVTDYYFDGGYQPTVAFKNLTPSYVKLNEQGIVVTDLMKLEVNDPTAELPYWTLDSIKPDIHYSTKIFNYVDGIDKSYQKLKNLEWRYSYRALTEDDVYTEYEQNDLIGNENTLKSYRCQGEYLILAFNKKIPSGGSISLYWFDNNRWKFVFGVNNVGNDTSSVFIYVSLIENREKTVYDTNMDPIYKIADYGVLSDLFTHWGEGNYVSGGSGGATPESKTQTYKFVDGNGGVKQSGTYNPETQTPDASWYTGDTPTKDGYTFDSWTKTVDTELNVTFTAVFKEIEKAIVIWKNDDGSVLATETSYKLNDTPVYPGSDVPISVNNPKAEFYGWTPTITPITEYTTYTYVAQYKIEASISAWTSLKEINTMLGAPTTGTISLENNAVDNTAQMCSKNALDTSLLGWSEYGVSVVTDDNGDDWFTGYLFNRDLTKISWDLTNATLTITKFGLQPEYVAFVNQSYNTPQSLGTHPWAYFSTSIMARSWMAGNTVGTKTIPYKYYDYVDTNTGTSYVYKYVGGASLSFDMNKQTSWKEVTTPTEVLASGICPIPESEWENAYVKGVKITYVV